MFFITLSNALSTQHKFRNIKSNRLWSANLCNIDLCQYIPKFLFLDAIASLQSGLLSLVGDKTSTLAIVVACQLGNPSKKKVGGGPDRVIFHIFFSKKK